MTSDGAVMAIRKKQQNLLPQIEKLYLYIYFFDSPGLKGDLLFVS